MGQTPSETNGRAPVKLGALCPRSGRRAMVAGHFLCELCFDALTTHRTTAWDGLEMGVCEDCLAPPAGHACWQTVGESFGVAEVVSDGRGEGYLVRLKNGATIHFRWDKSQGPRRTE